MPDDGVPAETQQFLALNGFRAPEPAGDKVQSFLQVLNDKRDGHLLVPPHQREADAWNPAKQIRYVERLCQSSRGCHPPGSIATYQLVTESVPPSAKYLNDGLQRLNALERLRSEPASFGLDAPGVDALLRQDISVQHRHYRSHQEAMKDFQRINDGTHLTPFELCRGYLTYMDGWKDWWEPVIAQVEAAVTHSEQRVQQSSRTERRDTEHKRRRDAYALFHRFLSGDRGHVAYEDIGASDVMPYLDKEQVVEQRLVALLAELGHTAVAREARTFRSFIEDETAQLEAWIQSALGAGRGISATSHRWLLHLAVWRRHNKVPRDQYARFVAAFLQGTDGSSVWKLQGERHQVTLSLAHLGKLPTLAEYAGMPDFCKKQQRARPRGLRPGYDSSHVLPFATNGDGPTFPEPAPTNRARGARPVEGLEPGSGSADEPPRLSA